jgi:pimeloyl-ACP methyl ester carboxylesterase
MQVLINDLVLRYERIGNGPVVLLVHGWGDSLSSFYEIQRSLSKEYDVIAVDLPGFGQSSQPPKPWTLNDYSKCLEELLIKLKVQTYALIGHSNGGAILITGLANNNLSANKLILLASAGIRDTDKTKKQALKVVAKSGKAITSVLPSSMKKNIRQKFYGRIGSDLLISPGMEETFKLVVGQDVQNDATKLDIPTLLIYGKNDQSTPVDYGKLLSSKIKGSQLKILDNAEHFVHTDQPHQVEKLIKEFLK